MDKITLNGKEYSSIDDIPNEFKVLFKDENNNGILSELEIRYNEIKKALEKINSGKGYGLCEVCNEPIDPARLEANPAATTCKKHMK